ncbi:MAG: nucleotide sugar dehydrogenase [Bacteroidales bacterium]|nr:nucleotide sugar dehydrogenase [Bacteroidales bacterium]
MKVCVQGLWHLGCVTAACLASLGNKIIGLDYDHKVIYDLNNGIPPIFEPGLEDLLKQGIAGDLLKFSDGSEIDLSDIEMLWIAYDTPVNEDDIADVGFVFDQIVKTVKFLPSETTIIISSQMPVGSIKKLEIIADHLFPDKHFGFVYSPENLRLGKALNVFLNPDRIIVGVRRNIDRLRLEILLNPITSNIEWMSVESAEMTKHAINAFLATSIVFMNEIASICELVGADAKEVERGLKSENRIGPKAYLSPGGPFAGGTLARDLVFLNNISSEKKLSTPLLSSILQSNDEHKNWVKRKIQSVCPELTQCSIAIWGLTYKPGTDTLRRSLSVELCYWLIDQGVSIQVHDPVVKELPLELSRSVKKCDNPLDVLAGVQILVIATEWPIYKEIIADNVAKLNSGLIIIDANRFLTQFASDNRFKYLAVGTSN